jgi:hypothetical protein
MGTKHLHDQNETSKEWREEMSVDGYSTVEKKVENGDGVILVWRIS